MCVHASKNKLGLQSTSCSFERGSVFVFLSIRAARRHAHCCVVCLCAGTAWTECTFLCLCCVPVRRYSLDSLHTLYSVSVSVPMRRCSLDSLHTLCLFVPVRRHSLDSVHIFVLLFLPVRRCSLDSVHIFVFLLCACAQVQPGQPTHFVSVCACAQVQPGQPGHFVLSFVPVHRYNLDSLHTLCFVSVSVPLHRYNLDSVQTGLVVSLSLAGKYYSCVWVCG